MITYHPWRLPPLGAKRAFSRIVKSVASGKGASVNSRAAKVVRMTSYSSMNGSSLAAGRLVKCIPNRMATWKRLVNVKDRSVCEKTLARRAREGAGRVLPLRYLIEWVDRPADVFVGIAL